MEYRDGLISLTENSNEVSGFNTRFKSNVEEGAILSLQTSPWAAQIAAVVDQTTLKLSRPWPHPSVTNVPFVIAQGFTPHCNLPYPTYADLDKAEMIRRAMLLIDRQIGMVKTMLRLRS